MTWVNIGEIDVDNTLDTVNYLLQDNGSPKLSYEQCKKEMVDYITKQLKIYKQDHLIKVDQDGIIYKNSDEEQDSYLDQEICDIVNRYGEELPI